MTNEGWTVGAPVPAIRHLSFVIYYGAPWFAPVYPPPVALLEIAQLRKSFRTPEGTVQSVIDVPQFTLDERAQVALRGESGLGKTTFLHLIAGILKPDSGSIRL